MCGEQFGDKALEAERAILGSYLDVDAVGHKLSVAEHTFAELRAYQDGDLIAAVLAAYPVGEEVDGRGAASACHEDMAGCGIVSGVEGRAQRAYDADAVSSVHCLQQRGASSDDVVEQGEGASVWVDGVDGERPAEQRVIAVADPYIDELTRP
jgi:hypothetical protein